MPDCHVAHKNAHILYAGSQHCTQKCTYSICRIAMLHTKMHRLCQPEAVLAPPADRASFWEKNRPPEHGEISSKKGHPDRFRAIPDQVPEKCFFQGYRLCRPGAQNAGKHVYSIRRDRPEHRKTSVFYKTDRPERRKTRVFYKTDRPEHRKTRVFYNWALGEGGEW